MNKTISDVADIIDCLHTTPSYANKGFPIVRVEDVGDKNIDWNNCLKVDETTCNYMNKKYTPQVGDIIITRVGSFGRMSYINDDVKFCLGQNISIIHPKINSHFLYYYLRSPYAQKFIFGNSNGSSYKSLSLEHINKIPFSVENLDLNKISSILENIDKKINYNCKIILNLESLAKTIYDYWFLQFEFPNEDGKPYKSSGGKMVWNEELKREIPEGWSVTNVGNITTCLDSKRVPLSSKDRESMKGPYPYYGATSEMGSVNEYLFDGDYVLLAEDGSVMDDNGFPILQRISGKVWVNNHAHVLQPKEPYGCKLLMFILKNIPVSMIKTGSIQMKVNQENLNAFKVLSIPENIIERANSILDPIDTKIIMLKQENQKLTSLRDFLLPMLMNGQVTFKEEL